jgi:hypothetical protein
MFSISKVIVFSIENILISGIKGQENSSYRQVNWIIVAAIHGEDFADIIEDIGEFREAEPRTQQFYFYR